MKIHRIALLASGLITLLTLGSGNAIVLAQDTPATATGSANLYLPLIADGNGNRAAVVAQDVAGQDLAAQEEQLATATAQLGEARFTPGN